jgi:nitrogen fixation NifU-like protein
MSDDIYALYQDLVLDHNAHPHNYKTLEGSTHQAHGNNPLCGDEIMVMLKLQGNNIEDAAFVGHGCAIAKASASMMTDALKGKSLDEAKALFTGFHSMLTTDERGVSSLLGKLEVFEGVKRYPVRVKCATLCWHTLMAAMKNEQSPVSTE